MNLLDRMRCRVQLCANQRAIDSDVCSDDLTDKWANRLVRQADGSYTRRRAFAARDETGRLAA